MALEAEVNVKLDGGAGGTPLLRLTVKEREIKRFDRVGRYIIQTETRQNNPAKKAKNS